jgi:hypothetical protein
MNAGLGLAMTPSKAAAPLADMESDYSFVINCSLLNYESVIAIATPAPQAFLKLHRIDFSCLFVATKSCPTKRG